MAEEQETTTQDNPVVEETLLGSGESDNPADWRSSLSEELKNDPTIQNINDIEAAAKTLVHQQKRMGSLVPIPKTDEERAELYDKLGRPETGEKYEIPQSIGSNTHSEISPSFNSTILEGAVTDISSAPSSPVTIHARSELFASKTSAICLATFKLAVPIR